MAVATHAVAQRQQELHPWPRRDLPHTATCRLVIAGGKHYAGRCSPARAEAKPSASGCAPTTTNPRWGQEWEGSGDVDGDEDEVPEATVALSVDGRVDGGWGDDDDDDDDDGAVEANGG